VTGFALPLAELPIGLHADPRVVPRLFDREALREVRFLWRQEPAVLPVWWQGRIHLVRWGCRRRAGTRLPMGGWVEAEAIEAGAMAAARPELVTIPAVLGEAAGCWYLINEGVRGVVLRDRDGPAVYVLTRPATNYYRNMTQQAATMPVLVGQTI
jgi:hypothetical protein